MIRTIEAPQIQAEWIKLLEAASRGEEIIITRDTQPVAKLIQATDDEGDLRYGSAKGLATMLPNFDARLTALSNISDAPLIGKWPEKNGQRLILAARFNLLP